MAAASQQMSVQVAAMAALGSVVQETMGHQSDSKERITAIESNAATVSQLHAVQQSTLSSYNVAASEILRISTRAEAQELRANRLEAQLDILRNKLEDAASTEAGARIDSINSVLAEGTRRTEWAVSNIHTEMTKQLSKSAEIQQQAIHAQG